MACCMHMDRAGDGTHPHRLYWSLEGQKCMHWLPSLVAKHEVILQTKQNVGGCLAPSSPPFPPPVGRLLRNWNTWMTICLYSTHLRTMFDNGLYETLIMFPSLLESCSMTWSWLSIKNVIGLWCLPLAICGHLISVPMPSINQSMNGMSASLNYFPPIQEDA